MGPTFLTIGWGAGGYYVSGTRITLDSVVCAFNLGESPEQILEGYPLLSNLLGCMVQSHFIWTIKLRSTTTLRTQSAILNLVASHLKRRTRCFGNGSNEREWIKQK